MRKYITALALAAGIGVTGWASGLGGDAGALAAGPQPSMQVQVTCTDAAANQLSVDVAAANQQGIRKVSLILFRGAPGAVADAETPLNLDKGKLPKEFTTNAGLSDSGIAWTTYQVRAELHDRHGLALTWDSAPISC